MTPLKPLASMSTPRAIGVHPTVLNEHRPLIRPVLILDVDRDSADARQHALARYGIIWIAIVHSVADVRRFIAAEPSAAAIMTLRTSAADEIELARELHGAKLPCLLLVEPAEAAHLEAADDLPPILPLDCALDSLFAALDRLGLGHRRS